MTEPTRRDFLYIATGAMGAVGVAGVAWPLINQMNPDAATLAAGAPVEVDVSSVEPGQQIVVKWRGKPHFVRHLTEAEIKAAKDLPAGDQKDPAPADQRLGGPEGEGDGSEAWTVVAANCTHLGCVPTMVNGSIEGWSCPCHGSIFDVAGRILSGPAPVNLPLPPYVFASEEVLVIGSDTAGA
ncbi:MAG: ubiquinol-cytochrome c reductase iron-sulfur subunit [Pseudomonadota bacterium]